MEFSIQEQSQLPAQLGLIEDLEVGVRRRKSLSRVCCPARTELGETLNPQESCIPHGVKLGEGDPASALESVTLDRSLEGWGGWGVALGTKPSLAWGCVGRRCQAEV